MTLSLRTSMGRGPVKFHVSNILQKLRVGNRAQAVSRYHRLVRVGGRGSGRGGWARPPRPLFDNEAMMFVHEIYQRADAFLFGRRTFELFAGYWGVRNDLEDPIVGALNTEPKYVASTTLTDPQWANTTVPSGDLAATIGELKPSRGVSCRCTAAAP